MTIRGGCFGACLFASTVVMAQGTTQAPGAETVAGTPDPSPYYLGVGEAITHDSNVYRIPSGPGDVYSTTSVFGGFDQRISRQRVHGAATVGLNRYRDQSRLDNTSYELATGLAWETIENLSGNVDAGWRQSLAAPAASAGQPAADRNLARTRTLDARARWGGASLLSVEGGYDRSSLDYSSPAYVSSQSNSDSGSLAVFYRPGGALRLGLGGRLDRTLTPQALLDPVARTSQSNTMHGHALDLFADDDFSGVLSANVRLSYTRQTNSTIGGADFSGLTGRIGLNWRPTSRLSLNADAMREAGFDTVLSTNPAVAIDSGGAGGTGGTGGAGGGATPATAYYENNRVTNTIDVGALYAVTAKINATAGGRYGRAKVIVTSGGAAAGISLPEAADVTKSAYVGADYAFLRNWSAACKVSRETRSVSGGVSYSYVANTVGCSTQLVWR